MTLQLAICYILGFGTVPQLGKAVEMISQAVEGLGHPIARIFGDQLCSGIRGDLSNTYNSSVIQCLQEGALALASENHPALLRASLLADAAAVRRLIYEGINTAEITEGGYSALHGLFIFGDEALSIGQRMLAQWDAGHESYYLPPPPYPGQEPNSSHSSIERLSAVQALDWPCTEIHRLHPQWPLEFSGTPLAFAIYAGSESAVAALLELGANPLAKIYHPEEANNHYKSAWTPFHLAASLHCPNILKMLLRASKSKNLSIEECFSGTPLGCSLPFSSKLERYAIHGCNGRQRLVETVQFLTASGACAVSSAGMTPLMQAIDFEDYDVVSALITCYPVVVTKTYYNPKNGHEWNLPVHFAAQLASWSKDLDNVVKILSLIIERDPGSLQATDSRGRTPLHLAVTGQTQRAAKWLLEHGADVNAKDDQGCQPLHHVSVVHIADLLLSSGAYLDRDKNGLSPLHHLCQRDSLDVLNMFIEKGAHLDPSLHDNLPHFAIRCGSQRTVAALLAGGVFVNGPNPDGDTPLHIATRASRADIVQALLIAGANRTIANRLGHLPLYIASHINNPTIVQILLSHNDVEANLPLGISSVDTMYRQTPLHVSAKTASVAVGKLLLAHGASQCVQDHEGRTPLHVVADMNGVDHAETEQVKFCQLLLRRKEVLLIPNSLNQLPWHLAWMNGNLTLLSCFLSQTYSLAGPQLTFPNQDARAVGFMLLETAITEHAIDLMDSLLAEREALGIPPTKCMESSVRPAINLALRNADRMLESVIDQLKEASRRPDKDDMRKGHLMKMLRKHKESRNETIKNFERELFRAAGFAKALLNRSEDAMERFIHKQPYYRKEILPRWVYLMFTHVQTSHPDYLRAWMDSEVKRIVWDELGSETIRRAGGDLKSEVRRMMQDEMESKVRRKEGHKLESKARRMMRNELERKVRRSVGYGLEGEVIKVVWDELEGKVIQIVENELKSKIRRIVQDELESEVIQMVWDELESEARRRAGGYLNREVIQRVDELGSEVIRRVDELESEVRRMVRDELESEVRRMVQNELENEFYGSRRINWRAKIAGVRASVHDMLYACSHVESDRPNDSTNPALDQSGPSKSNLIYSE